MSHRFRNAPLLAGEELDEHLLQCIICLLGISTLEISISGRAPSLHLQDSGRAVASRLLRLGDHQCWPLSTSRGVALAASFWQPMVEAYTAGADMDPSRGRGRRWCIAM